MSSRNPRSSVDPEVGGRVLLDGILDDLDTVNGRYARIVTAVIDVKARGVAERLEGLTLEQVLMTRADLPIWDARRIIATAEVLAHMPRLLARFTAGEVAWATVATLAKELRSLTVEQRGACAPPWSCATAAAASRAAANPPGSASSTTSSTAATADPRPWTIWSRCAAPVTAACTTTAGRSPSPATGR